MNKVLTICIPTYNRADCLKYNLDLLNRYINIELSKKIEIIISNNGSNDNTDTIVLEHPINNRIRIIYNKFKENKGLIYNFSFVINRVETDWLMLLGDDDYLHEDYLSNVIKEIQNSPSLSCIIPNFIGVTPEGKETCNRDPKGVRTYFKKGFDSCLQNSWKAHQMSGLVFRKTPAFDELKKQSINNLYPQIFLIAYSCLHGDCLYLPEYSTKVTQISQSNKDWNYGDDGLINDICQNYKKIGISQIQRGKLEEKTFKLNWYLRTTNHNLAIEKILLGKNVSYIGKYYFAKKIIREEGYTGKKCRIILYVYGIIALTLRFVTGKSVCI